MNICCVTNNKYIKFTLALINSIRCNCYTQYNIICLCVNVDSKNKQLLEKFNVSVISIDKELSKVKTMLTPDGTSLTPIHNRDKNYGSLISEEAAFCSNKRFELVYDTLCVMSDDVLFLDVDAIVRKDLSVMKEMYRNNDITIRKTKNQGIAGTQKRLRISEPDNIIYQQGVFFVRNNDKTKSFYKSLNDRVNTDLKNWNADQIYFIDEINKHNLTIGQLDSTFKDIFSDIKDGGLKNSSHIWSGAYTDKYNNERYINEYNKYKIID